VSFDREDVAHAKIEDAGGGRVLVLSDMDLPIDWKPGMEVEIRPLDATREAVRAALMRIDVWIDRNSWAWKEIEAIRAEWRHAP